MVKEFKLPDIGEGVHEGEIIQWLVKEGDPIKEEQLMVEVMTDKATVQIPCPWTGTVKQLLAKEGEVVNTGAVIVTIDEEGGSSEPKPPSTPAAEPPVAVVAPPAPSVSTAPAGNILATPAVRKLARELGVDIGTVEGSGPRGRVTESDLRTAQSPEVPAAPVVEMPSEVPPPGPTQVPAKPAGTLDLVTPAGHAPKGELEERIPVVGLRKRIRDKMAKSMHTAAHFTFIEEVDMGALVHLRQRTKETAAKKGVKLTYLPFIVKALVGAIKDHPIMNATLDDAKDEIVIKHYYNIGIATATEDGLTVIVLHDADKKDVWQLAAEITELSEAARTKRIRVEDLQGSTFTITSLGAMGGIVATPIINHPEVAILGIHRIEKRPVVHGESIVVRDMMYASCSFDHRVIDGHIGAAFMQTLKEYLEHPALLMLGA